MLNFLVITVSDTCSQDPTKDASGPALVGEIKKVFPNSVQRVKIVPDDLNRITEEMRFYCDVQPVDGIFTTGGTGFGPRDVTPEATRAIIEREAHTVATVMTIESLKVTPMAALSRATAGIRRHTLIVNFPGSVKAVQQCFQAISAVLPHAISLIRNEASAVKQQHDAMAGDSYAHGHECPHANKHSKVNLTRVALRERESSYAMIEIAEASRIIEEEMNTLIKLNTKEVSLMECAGRALASNVQAADPLPPFPASIKDGYACISGEGAGARRVRGAVCAGDMAAQPVGLGECVRISTGAPVPLGADCVVQVEDTKLLKCSDDGDVEYEIEILKNPKPGEDVRPVGHDIRQGETVVREGTLLDAGNIGILATVGVDYVSVYLPPRVGILSTGNELQDSVDELLQPGHIRDSNKIMLTVLLREYGFECVDCGISKDDPESMKYAIESAFGCVDVLITTGSVSMGERDMLKPVIVNDFKGTIHFGRTNMKPGKPTTFATCLYRNRKKYVFGLPGNPVSAYVTCLLLAVPALRRCAGLPAGWAELPVALATQVKLDQRPEYARATLVFRRGELPTVTLTGNQCSSRLLSTCGASVLVVLPAASAALTHLPPGATVTALLTARPQPNPQ